MKRWALCALLLTAPLAAEELSPVVIPPVDVEANVRRLLEAGAISGEPSAPSSLEIPPLDVEANVRKALEEGRSPSLEGGPAALPAPEEATPAPAKPAPVKLPPEQKRPDPAPLPAPEPDVEYLSLPTKEITIRGVGDVEAVAKELERARGKK